MLGRTRSSSRQLRGDWENTWLAQPPPGASQRHLWPPPGQVREIGHKWYRIAQRIPGRTEHAIRNRWQRLLKMVEEQQAPPPPPPVPPPLIA